MRLFGATWLWVLLTTAGWAQSTVSVDVIVPGQAVENGINATLRFSRSVDLNGTLTVNFTRDPTTTASDDDFSANDNGSFEGLNRVVFGDGEAERLVVITATPDNLVEGDELFDITLAPGDYMIGAPASASITLVDDPPVVTVTAQSPATENGVDGQFVFERSGGKIDAPLNVNFTRDGTTTADNTDIAVNDNGDFRGRNLVNLAANQSSRAVTITAVADNLVEGNELFAITLAPGDYVVGNPGSASMTLVDDPPVVTVTAQSPATENGVDGQFVFERSGGRIDASLNVDFAIDETTSADNSDIAVNDNGDFQGRNRVNLAANQSSRAVTITATADNLVEGDEFFDITLASGDYVIGDPASASITLVDDPAAVTVTALDGFALEGVDGASFLFQRSGGAVSKTLNVSFSRDPTTTIDADDIEVDDNGSFQAFNLVAILAGQTDRTINITAVADGILEEEERLDITIAGDGTTFVAGSPSSASIVVGKELIYLDGFEELLITKSCAIDKLAAARSEIFVDAGPVLVDETGLAWLRCSAWTIYNEAAARCELDTRSKAMVEGQTRYEVLADFHAGIVGNHLGFGNWRWASPGELTRVGLQEGACLVFD